MSRVALATCAAIPELEPDDRLLLPALAAHGIEGVPAVWDDSAVEWDAFDLVVLRSTWDYAERRDEFLAWARSLRRVENPVPLLEWNTDKRYLERLAAAGSRRCRRGSSPRGRRSSLPPSPSSSSRRCRRADVARRGSSPMRWTRPGRSWRTIHAEGRTAMIQPYLSGAEEKAVVYIGGEYSHALLRRVPLPAAGSLSVLYLEEELAPADSSAEDRETAMAALACAPDHAAVRPSRPARRRGAGAGADGAIALSRVRRGQRRPPRGRSRRDSRRCADSAGGVGGGGGWRGGGTPGGRPTRGRGEAAFLGGARGGEGGGRPRRATVPLTDTFGRPLRDLRISVTDRCNFRCVYCMPKEVFGREYEFLGREELLTFEEIERIARVFVARRRGEVPHHRRRAPRPPRPARARGASSPRSATSISR